MSNRPRWGAAPPRVIGAALLLLGGLTAAVTGPGTAGAATPSFAVPPTGTLAVTAKGNGHGHGLSQYGAYGAAQAGLSANQILAFYYPGATVTTLAASNVRVLLSNTGPTTTVGASPGLTVTGVGALPTTGVDRYRLVAGAGSSLTLQKLVSATWSNAATGLANGAAFSRPAGDVRLYLADGTSTVYYGSLRALNAGGSVNTVNVVGLDYYAQGVAPRESPASWPAAAVAAQAVAARTYGRYEVVHAASGTNWDICDTTSCQVYGGHIHYATDGTTVLWTDDPAALSGNSNQVLTYGGQPIFAQYSASNGGWTVDGGQPYLPAKADPYDTAALDPYFSYNRSVSVSSLAGYYGLRQVTQIQVDSRDGHGTWGGRVESATIVGLNSGGATTSVATTGYSLASALGLGTTWFTFPQAPPSAPTALAVQARDGSAYVTWGPPASSGTGPVTQYAITVGGKRVTAAAAARAAWVTGLPNGATYSLSLQADSAVGLSPAATATVTPVAVPQSVSAVTPARLLDTRTQGTPVTPSAPLLYGVPGHGSVPTSQATAVTLAVTIVNPTASGSLRVFSRYGQPVGTAAIAYRANQVVTATVNVPFTPSGMVEFLPSAGSLNLVIDQEGYSASTGGRITTLADPMLLANVASVSNSATGRVISVRGHTGIPATVTAALVSVKAFGPPGWLALWPDQTARPAVSQVSVNGDRIGSNLVLVPVGSTGSLRIVASTAAIGAQVSLVGYVDAQGGLLETLAAAAVADATAGGTSLRVTTSATSLKVAGVAGVPATGVSAVLLQVTGSGANGTLFAYGATRPTSGGTALSTAGANTATVLVPVTGSSVNLAMSAGQATVAVDVLGYIASG